MPPYLAMFVLNLLKSYLSFQHICLNKEKDNTSLINYMYYEWFDSTKSNNKYNDLSTVVTQSYCEKHDKLLKVIDLLNCNNV